jgi:hypothetical protein
MRGGGAVGSAQTITLLPNAGKKLFPRYFEADLESFAVFKNIYFFRNL